MTRGIVALVFRCTPITGQLAVTSEAEQVQWMELDEIKIAMTPAYFVRVADAFGTEAQVASHDGVNLR